MAEINKTVALNIVEYQSIINLNDKLIEHIDQIGTSITIKIELINKIILSILKITALNNILK